MGTLEVVGKDRVNNTGTIKIPFIKDTTPPTINYEVIGDYITAEDGTIILAQSSKIKIIASDEQSGVKQINYRIDDGEWKSVNANGQKTFEVVIDI